MGNVVLFKRGRKSDKVRAVLTHTDEVGFIVKSISDKGYIKFEEVGNFSARGVISKQVEIGESAVKGIIGMRAVHVQKRDERESTAAFKSLYADIGAKSKKAAEKQVKTGDYINFATKAKRLTETVISGKALDRIGVYCVLKAMEKQPEYDTCYIFAAQQHTGNRGAMTALEKIDADEVLIIDTIESADMGGVKKDEITAKLHEGAVIVGMDKRGIANGEAARALCESANEHGIQTRIIRSNDESAAGVTGYSYGGRRAVSLAIPCRYRNTPVALVSMKDIDSALAITEIYLGNE